MKNLHTNLHLEQKRVLLMIVFFSAISSFLNFIVTKSTNANFTQLNSLMRSDYIYSANMRTAIAQDSYYKFNAGISFAISVCAEIGLNADILMQAIDVEYTDSIDWNADKLGSYGIAVSQNIARDNGLTIGDKLYSKHFVDGRVYEYNIEQILPEVTNVRVTKEKKDDNGIIIMGYDRRYIDNITYRSIVYTKDSIDELAAQYSEMPENIVYRREEIIIVGKNLLPHLVLFITLSVLEMIGLVFFLTRHIEHNFKRLIMLGFEKKALNKSYFKFIFSTGALSIIMTLCIVIGFVSFNQIELVFLLIVIFIKFVTLLGFATILNRRLWRK